MRQLRSSSPSVLLLGPVRGLVGDGAKVRSALERFSPGWIGVGLGKEEVESLERYFGAPGAEPLVPLSPSEVGYARGLARFGPVRVPSPAFLAALAYARSHQVPLEGLDADEGEYADLFVEHIGYWDLLRRNRAERALARSPPETGVAEGYATEWEDRLSSNAGSRRLEEARSGQWSARVEEARRAHGGSLRIALVVDVEKVDGLTRRLGPLVEETEAGPLPRGPGAPPPGS